LEAPGVRVPDKAEAMLKAKVGDTWKSNSDFLREVRRIPEITKVISETELVKLCSVEQHFNQIDETLASWKQRRISRPGNESAPHNSPTVI
jgi:hypothetical protein